MVRFGLPLPRNVVPVAGGAINRSYLNVLADRPTFAGLMARPSG
jgi:hypothetical protein